MEKDENYFDQTQSELDKFGGKKYNDKDLKEEMIEDISFTEKFALGFFRCAYYISGELSLTKKGRNEVFSFRNAVVALKFCKAVEFLTGESVEMAFNTPYDKRKSRRFVIEIPEKIVIPLFEKTGEYKINKNGEGTLELKSRIPKKLEGEFGEGFFSMMYLEAGKLTLYDDYKLEIQFEEEYQANDFFLFFTNRDIHVGLLSESNKLIFRTESIGEFFALAGANKVAIDLSLYYTNKSINKDITRKENFKIANLDKTLTASARQTVAIMTIRNADKFGLLPGDLRELAEEREKNPDASIQQIAQTLGISKSTAYHRMERIIEFANGVIKK